MVQLSHPYMSAAKTIALTIQTFVGKVMSLLSHVQLFCDPVDHSPPGSSVHRTSQARTLEWVCHFLLQGIFPIQGSKLHLQHWQGLLYHWATRETLLFTYLILNGKYWKWAWWLKDAVRNVVSRIMEIIAGWGATWPDTNRLLVAGIFESLSLVLFLPSGHQPPCGFLEASWSFSDYLLLIFYGLRKQVTTFIRIMSEIRKDSGWMAERKDGDKIYHELSEWDPWCLF